MKYQSEGGSDVGRKREKNEDCFLMSPGEGTGLFVVADGVGGKKFGEVASKAVVAQLHQQFLNHRHRFEEYTLERDQELREGLLQLVSRMIETMDPREATVLRMRFGLNDLEPRTLKEIGEELGLTRERVRQIETEALNRLADSLKDPREREEEMLAVQ